MLTESTSTGRPPKGFTLLEMMVAVAILAVMMLIFGVVISQTQETLNAAHDLILAEREAAAVSSILEQDLRAITRSGYLRVVGGDRLAFTIAGPHESMLARDDGNLTTSGVNTLSDNTKGWPTDTWVGGLVRINDAIHPGTLGGVTTDTGTDSDGGVSWTTNQWAGSIVKVTAGRGAGTIRQVVANNNARTFTVSPPWTDADTTAGKPEIDPTDLVLYLKFNDVSDPTNPWGYGKDYSGNENHGTPTGAVPGDTAGYDPLDVSDRGADMSISGSFTFDVTKFNPIINSNYLTIALWTDMITGPHNGNNVFWFPTSRATTNMAVMGGPHNDARPYTDYMWPCGRGWTSYGGIYRTTVPAMVQGGYHHIAFRVGCGGADGNGSEMYIDGNKWLGPGSFQDSFGPWVDSVVTFSPNQFQANVDEVAVWGRYLSVEEIQKLASGDWVPKATAGSTSTTGPMAGDTYGLFFPPYPIVDSSGQQITVSPDWMATLPGGLSYTTYFASNSALVDYGRITSGENQNILWRRLKLLVPEAASSHDDVLAVSLQSVNDATYTVFCSPDPTFNLPPTQLSDWFDYLVKNCSTLQVAVYDKATSSWVGNWSSQGKTLDQWPTAVRVTFVLRGKKYELITNIN